MTESPHHLFVYGTLLSTIGHPAHRMLADGATLAGTGTIPGRLYDSGDDYPAAVPSDRAGERITGELYALRRDQEGRVLARLDRYEGISAAGAGESLFRRVSVEVDTLAGDRVQAWTYVYNRSTAGLSLVPDGDYAAYLARMG